MILKKRVLMLLLIPASSLLTLGFLFHMKVFGANYLAEMSDDSSKLRSRNSSILIVTYMRSGSSLLGDLMQQNADVFYVYEPLRRLDFFRANGNNHLWLHGGEKREIGEKSSEYLRNIESWLHCNLTAIDLYSMAEREFMNFGNKTRRYSTCLQTQPNINWIRDIETCISSLKLTCDESAIKLIKTIRLNMTMVSLLLDRIPDLRVIYLVRDPRAVLYSRRNYGAAGWNFSTFVGDARDFCRSLDQDQIIAQALFAKHPKRIVKVYFEDIVSFPEVVLKQLYSFAKIGFSFKVLDYISHIMRSGRSSPEKCYLCTTKKNSSSVLYTWREKFPFSFVRAVDESCRNFLSQNNFIPFKNEEHLLDMSAVSRLNPDTAWYSAMVIKPGVDSMV